jgi:hypothetical protein
MIPKAGLNFRPESGSDPDSSSTDCMDHRRITWQVRERLN